MIKEIVHRIYEDSETGFNYLFNPIEDTINIEETETGYTVKYLIQDEMPMSPAEWGDDGLFLVNYHSYFYVKKDDIVTEDDIRDFYHGEKIPQQKDYHIFPLSCLIHSGIWLSLSDSFSCDPGGWDTSHVGAILASKKEWKKRDKAFKAAYSLMEEWNRYLSGDVYCLVSERFDKEKNQINYDVIGGYSGYKYALEALKTEI
jgi:hypothetical protein